MGLLDAAHLHAHVLGLHNHHHPQRAEGVLDTLLDLQRHALLHLQAVAEDVHHTGNLAESGDVAVGDIGHVHLAEEGQHVVLAEAVEVDVAYNDHLAVVLAEHGRAQHLGRVLAVAAGEHLQRLGHTLGGFQQTFAVGVFANKTQHRGGVGLQLCRHLLIVNRLGHNSMFMTWLGRMVSSLKVPISRISRSRVLASS